jgi:cell division protein FtsI/penicillin-binding protein 2
VPVQSLQRKEGTPGTPVRTTLDRRIQSAAEQTLATVAAGKNAALVAVDRTGGIKAIALPASTGFNWATGTYPPGSTFKVVTAAALLQKGLTAETPLTCPVTINAAGSTYHNFEDENEPSLTFARAFAISCNTAFIGAAQQLSGADMQQMVARFGFNVDYDAGLPMAVHGKFPDDGPGAARSAQAIGQGSVLTNPVHMASVAATALTGRWQAPSLLADRTGLPSGQPLDQRVADTLNRFMRETVEYGTGKSAAVPGKVVAGKTGTAEIGTGPEPETHAWFIGFSGDLAVAVVVDKGGVGGEVAAPIAGNFFARLG